jgi:hypothetical protein
LNVDFFVRTILRSLFQCIALTMESVVLKENYIASHVGYDVTELVRTLNKLFHCLVAA